MADTRKHRYTPCWRKHHGGREPGLRPARLTADLDPRLSRRLWLVKWLLALPHRVALVFLRVAFVGVSVAALFPIPLTVRCPRALFDVNAGVPAVPLDQGGPEPEGPA